MFSFMKKDKEKDREKKEKKKKDKEEKHEKKEKREKKERQNITPEEMSRLEDVKRSVFHRLSDRDHYRKSHKTADQGTVGKSESSESNISAASESSSSGTQPSPSRELPSSGVSRSKSMPGQKDQEKARPKILPKPRSILKGKSPAGGHSMRQSHDKLDDTKTLQDNTRLNEEMSGITDVTQSTQLQSSAMPPSATQKLEPVEELHTEKSFEGKNLPLPPLVPSKPPRIREVTVKRNASCGFGFSLRKGTLSSTDGSGVRFVVFAEPGLGSSGNQTALLPGDRLVELNGKNVESWSREEIVEVIKTVGDSMVLKVQPIPELIELSVRPGKDGGTVDMQEDVVRGGTLKRSGSMRYRKPVRCFFLLLILFMTTAISNHTPQLFYNHQHQ